MHQQSFQYRSKIKKKCNFFLDFPESRENTNYKLSGIQIIAKKFINHIKRVLLFPNKFTLSILNCVLWLRNITKVQNDHRNLPMETSWTCYLGCNNSCAHFSSNTFSSNAFSSKSFRRFLFVQSYQVRLRLDEKQVYRNNYLTNVPIVMDSQYKIIPQYDFLNNEMIFQILSFKITCVLTHQKSREFPGNNFKSQDLNCL